MPQRHAIVIGLVLLTAACGSSSGRANRPARPSTTSTSTTTAPAATAPNATPCGATTAPPAHYDSVVVFSFENRSWDDVGPGFGDTMPYLHGLGQQCSWFPDWTETDQHEKSLMQYVGQVTGARQANTVADCKPSDTCSTTADSIFRQVATSGRDAVDFVEGATTPCSAEGNAAKHIPALYLWAPEDRARCAQQVRPFTDFDPDRLPAFAWISPTLCNDGHDCGDDTVDAFARAHIQPVIDSAAYRAGKVAVFVWYDESTPVPNLWITPTAPAGARAGVAAGAAGTLRAWESMLGLPCLADACTAPDLRTAAHS
ncbi:MAG: hypothetical protein ACXVJ7_15555 [Acidimicrobiia bacterium]